MIRFQKFDVLESSACPLSDKTLFVLRLIANTSGIKKSVFNLKVRLEMVCVPGDVFIVAAFRSPFPVGRQAPLAPIEAGDEKEERGSGLVQWLAKC